VGRRTLKNEILALLATDDFDQAWQELRRYPPAQLLGPLFSSLCRLESRLRWHAVRAFGLVVPALAAADPEAARVVMRRFLWSLNDESGGIGWGAPEAMAEIMCHSELLRREYRHMLLSYMRQDGEEAFQDGNYLELPVLQRGVLWGVGRLCAEHREEMAQAGITEDLAAYLDSPDPEVVGLAIRALGFLAPPAVAARIARHLGRNEELRLPSARGEEVFLVGQLAAEALRRCP
jgi:hypothetical protein